MKLVFMDSYLLDHGDLDFTEFEKFGEVVMYKNSTKEEYYQRAKDADMIFINSLPVKRDFIEQFPNIKYIGLHSTGYNHVDIEACKDNGVVVTNIPVYGTEAVAQHTFALLLALTNKVSDYCRAVREGEWIKDPNYPPAMPRLMELMNKKVGVIGNGNIGKAFIEIALAFNMEVLVYSNRKSDDIRVRNVDMDTLLRESDVITLHCPLNDATKNILDKNAFDKMKKGVLILNTARGGLINEDDLVEALESGKVAGAGLDVVKREPIPLGSPLLKYENCIITSHMAWLAYESRKRLFDTSIKNVEGFLSGNVINSIY